MNKFKRLIPMVLMIALCLCSLSSYAFAYADPPEQTITVPDSDTAETIPEDIFTEEDPGCGGGSPYDEPSLTPDGNMTMIDDIIDIYYSDELAATRQFITLQTKNGNYFYLIIDRTSDTENVYFLNLVDEADLMALIEEDDSIPVPACGCKDKCVIGSIDTTCEVCRVNMSECVGKEPVVTEPDTQEQESTPEKEPEKSKASGVTALIVLVIVGTGAAVYFIKFRKPKADTKGADDLDDYDFGQDDDFEEDEVDPISDDSED